MKKRAGVSHALKSEVRRREGGVWCTKCGDQEDVTYHHRQAVADGGLDVAENIVQLCGLCHHEWHHYGDGNMSFEEWLAIPPVHYFLAAAAAHLRGTAPKPDYDLLAETQRITVAMGRALQVAQADDDARRMIDGLNRPPAPRPHP